ncbi:hypothetical protein MGM1_4730 [Candidatus Malacoplasma girerdii]|uniref:Uncharacterized protein n=1 Tax=Candidatus Malacoplasma girerdii TaxID=1318617 RepID=A0A097STB6_9BACT|nr:hypothetical protein MGM1_4730 [Candidatus Malacoplasma girerdii]
MFIKLYKPDISTEWLKQFQAWTGTVSNWSMGILGIFVIAVLSRNMITALNQKLLKSKKIIRKLSCNNLWNIYINNTV